MDAKSQCSETRVSQRDTGGTGSGDSKVDAISANAAFKMVKERVLLFVAKLAEPVFQHKTRPETRRLACQACGDVTALYPTFKGRSQGCPAGSARVEHLSLPTYTATREWHSMVDFGSKPDRRSLLGALSLGACAAPEYSYELDRGSAVDPRMKACHGPDQPFLFDNVALLSAGQASPGRQSSEQAGTRRWRSTRFPGSSTVIKDRVSNDKEKT